jgi:ubiquinone/menaquinone biosynthesis C-methylase UbiE
MGCGPGYLMQLLLEVGIPADGLDISPASIEMAPAEVRGRIRVGSLLDADLPDRSYDLVICREVLEHLPVLDVNRAVLNMCRVSSRFVYVTTRFHPAPTSLLDLTSEPEVDPTHITLMNKNLLRLMFVLAGFKRRGDLEDRMDWLKKGRVLVYERARLQDAAPRPHRAARTMDRIAGG